MHGKHGRRAVSTEVYASKPRCRFQNPRVMQEISGRDDPRALVEGYGQGVVGVVVVPGRMAAPFCEATGGGSSPPAAGRSGRRRSRYVAPADERSARACAAISGRFALGLVGISVPSAATGTRRVPDTIVATALRSRTAMRRPCGR